MEVTTLLANAYHLDLDAIIASENSESQSSSCLHRDHPTKLEAELQCAEAKRAAKEAHFSDQAAKYCEEG